MLLNSLRRKISRFTNSRMRIFPGFVVLSPIESKAAIPGEFEKWTGYDLICGKIANDQTNTVITAFLDGVYGPIDSDRAAELAISFLEPENLTNQWCFRTPKALNCLKFLSAEEVYLHGK